MKRVYKQAVLASILCTALVGLCGVCHAQGGGLAKGLRYVPQTVKDLHIPAVVNPNLPLSTQIRVSNLNAALDAALARTQLQTSVVSSDITTAPLPLANDPTSYALQTSFDGVPSSLSAMEDIPVRQMGRRTPAQWLEELQAYIAKYGDYPRSTIRRDGKLIASQDFIPEEKAEAALAMGVKGAIARAKDPNDPVIVQLRELKELYRKQTAARTPAQWLEELQAYIAKYGNYPRRKISRNGKPVAPQDYTPEEKFEIALANGVKGAIASAKDPNDPIIVQLREFQEQYRKKAVTKTPVQWLEELKVYIAQHGDYPRQAIYRDGKLITAKDYTPEEKAEVALAQGVNGAIARAKDPNDSVVVQLRELKGHYVKEIAVAKTPAQWLEALQAYIAKYGDYPRRKIYRDGKLITAKDYTPEEKAEVVLAHGVINAIVRSKNPNDPVIIQFKAIKKQYRRIETSKTPAQWLEALQAYISQHGDYPRISIYRDGKSVATQDYTSEEKEEKTLATGVNNAIARAKAPNDPVIVQLQAIKDKYRKIAQSLPTDELYQTLARHIKETGSYPHWDSYLYNSILKRLSYYRSTMIDGKYADPWLQKIYELRQWNDRVKRGEVDWDKFPGLFKKHRRTIGEMRAQGLLPTKEVAQELEVLPVEEQQAIEQMADNLLSLWEDFEEVWWQSNQNYIIMTPQTQVAFNTVRNTVRNQIPGASNVNISNVLEQVNAMSLGQDGPDYYRVIYRGNNPRIPRAEDFHNVQEVRGLPQDFATVAYRLNSPHIELNGDEDTVYTMVLRQGVTDRELSAVIDTLTPTGWEVRIGAHELLSQIKNGRIHIHIEKIVPVTEEDAMDISNVLNVNLGELTRGNNPQQVAKTLRYLFSKYLKEDGQQALDKIQRAF